MKITQFRQDGNNHTQRTQSIELVVAAMKTELKGEYVSTLRKHLDHPHSENFQKAKNKLHLNAFGGVFRRSGSRQELIEYNGLVLLEVNRLADRKEAIATRDLAARLPQTLLAFVGSSNRSVKILVPFTLPDGSLPQDLQHIELFHANAYREAVNWYQPQLKRDIDIKKPDPMRCCRMTFDPTLFYNPNAAAIRIEQPVRMPDETTFVEYQQNIPDPLMRLLPGFDRYWTIATLFETCLTNAMNEMDTDGWDEDVYPFIRRLAENCYDSGIPQEDAIRNTLSSRSLVPYETTVRLCFKNAYHLQRKFGGKPCITTTMALSLQVDEFIKRRYLLRRNTIKGVVEYRELKTHKFDFRPVTTEVLNSMVINIHNEGINAWDKDMRRYVYSDHIPVHDPIEVYLCNLPAWDGKDHIRALAQRVKCSNPRWADLFYTWFLSMVAHWQQLDKQHANSTLPLLVGDQGCGKSTFCLNILPPELREYYTDSIDFSNKRDAQLALNRFALINMDEFDSISPSYQGFLKHILQKATVQTKRPYGTSTEQLRRYATFIATSNNFDLLTDPTGSRRFICIEVEGIIDDSQPIDYGQLYAQAIQAIRNKERFWFTRQDEEYITKSNMSFQQLLPEEEIIFFYFRAPKAGEQHEELTCTEMLERIREVRPDFKISRSISMKLGRILKKKLVSKIASRGMTYKVVAI